MMNDCKPIPCVRDEHGEIKEQTVKQLFTKIDEELNEFKIAIFQFWEDCGNGSRLDAVEEAADTITAITTMLEALGIDEAMRDEAQRRVNAKNRERGAAVMEKDELDVMIFALRYAVSRNTFASQIVCGYIEKQIPRMSMDYMWQIIDELHKMEKYKEFSDEYAKKAGMKLLFVLKEVLHNAGQDEADAGAD